MGELAIVLALAGVSVGLMTIKAELSRIQDRLSEIRDLLKNEAPTDRAQQRADRPY